MSYTLGKAFFFYNRIGENRTAYPHNLISNYVIGLLLYILIDVQMHIDTISMGQPIMYFKGSHVIVSKFNKVFLFLKVASILANSSDPDEMQHYAAFYLGLNSFPKNWFRGFRYYYNTCHTLTYKICQGMTKPRT